MIRLYQSIKTISNLLVYSYPNELLYKSHKIQYNCMIKHVKRKGIIEIIKRIMGLILFLLPLVYG